MTFELINENDYNFLMESQENYKNLTLQNVGYEEINKELLTEEEKTIINKIDSILRKSIVGFSRFQNFKINKKGDIVIRLQYDYSADKVEVNRIYFVGVGYITINELFKGL